MLLAADDIKHIGDPGKSAIQIRVDGLITFCTGNNGAGIQASTDGPGAAVQQIAPHGQQINVVKYAGNFIMTGACKERLASDQAKSRIIPA
ncbi:MAG: hypothetical protein ACYDHM_15865, partial [Acidiferrobacterales bacterium]